MGIFKLLSALPPGGRAYVKGYQRFGGVITVGILLLLQPIRIYSNSVGFVAEPGIISSGISASGGAFDCTARGRIGKGDFDKKGLQEGIDEAFRILKDKDCQSCRQLYGNVDAEALLKQYVEKRAIIMTEWVPTKRLKVDRGWVYIGDIEAIKGTTAVSTLRYSRRNTTYRPCIYVNPSSILGSKATYVDPSLFGNISLRQARGVVILHELAHLAEAVPDDDNPDMDEVSFENTRCIKRNCAPCAQQLSACIYNLTPHVSSERGRGKSSHKPSPAQRKQP
jgi:hypothetical protein